MKPAKTYEFTLAAGASFRLLAAGTFFKLLAVTGLVDVKAERIDLQGLGAGDGVKGEPFDYLQIIDKSGAGNTVRLVVADAEFLNAPQVSMSVTANKNPQSSSFVNTQKTVTNASAQLLPANAARQYLLIQNKSGSGFIYVEFGGPATVGEGIRIGPGGFWEWDSVIPTNEVRAIGDIPSNPDVVVVEG